MNLLGSYQPGDSVLHRLPAGVKFLALCAGLVVITNCRTLVQLGLCALGVALLYLIARIPPRTAAGQLWMLRWFVAFVLVFQLILATWQRALLVSGGLVVSVALAALLTLTTRVSAMLETFRRFFGLFRRVGVDADRLALLFAMTIRCVPLVAQIIRDVLDARRARGLGWSLRALAVPVVVRSLHAADQLGDALTARGADD